MAFAPEQAGIGIRRHFTTDGVHPYDMVEWERRDARITNFRDGTVAFEQLGVEFPVSWSLNATNIVAQKYFRGTLGTPEREWSLRQVVDRVADTITRWGVEGGYFVDDAEAAAFDAELKYMLVTQRAAFNSPVWFNIGVNGVPQPASACFSLAGAVSDGIGLKDADGRYLYANAALGERFGRSADAIVGRTDAELLDPRAATGSASGEGRGGLPAIVEKGKRWADNHEGHSSVVNGPWPNGDRFIVRFTYDITNKPSGKRIKMDETALFTIENGKIVREEFFYAMG